MTCVSYLYQKYQALEDPPPLIVNTMGWNKGAKIFVSKVPSNEFSPYRSSDRYKAIDHRNLSLLAYLSGQINIPRSLSSLKPYKIPWNSVAVHVFHASVPNSQIMNALNGSIVGLCTLDSDLVSV